MRSVTHLIYLILCLVFSQLFIACDNKDIKQQVSVSHKDKKENNYPAQTHLVRGIEAGNFHINPQLVTDKTQLTLITDLYEGLTRINPLGQLEAGLAESWQQKNDTEWVFYLREGLQWSNGEPLIAQDFVDSWQRLAKQKENPLTVYLTFLRLINANKVVNGELIVEHLGIKALDDRTLQLTLSQSLPYLPWLLSHPVLMPLYQENNEAEKSSVLVSNGAYRLNVPLSANKDRNSIVLEKNPFYWDKEKVSFENVVYKKSSSNNQYNEFDIIKTNQVPDSIKAPYKLLLLPSLCSYYYEFNFSHPQLSEVKVRQAIASLISLPEVMISNNSFLRPINQWLPRELRTTTESRSLDQVVAEQLLVQAGISNQQPLRLRITFDDQGLHKKIGEQLVRQLGQSDLIKLDVEQVAYSQLLAKRDVGDFDLIRSGWCADYPHVSAFFNILHSDSQDNKINYHSPELDLLLEQSLLNNLEETERVTLYQKIETMINKAQLTLPLFQYYSYYLIKDDLNFDYSQINTETIPSQYIFRRITQ